MEWLHLPIPDVSKPEPELDAKRQTVSKHLRSRLDEGENILIHCRGGAGRSSMVAARLLVEFGVDAETAIARGSCCPPKGEAWYGMGGAA
jgi:ADP-ribosyl-[dinitrogen reductase] hydrolase